MNGFAAIDFETANNRSNSACQLGIVIVEDWKIVANYVWLIRPPRMYFSPFCVQVHGITARDCMDSPTWPSIWSDVESILSGRLIVGHNVGFDAAVLLGCCQHYDIAVPRLEIQCTRLISKKSWPGFAGHGLAKVAKRLGIEFRHHDALEDARACALIAIHAAQKLGLPDFEEIEMQLGLKRGNIWVDRVRNPRSMRVSRSDGSYELPSRIEPKRFRQDGLPSRQTSHHRAELIAQAILDNCGASKPLQGKSIVLIHSLLGLERAVAKDFLQSLGANVQSQINMQTQYVVVGTAEEPIQQPSLSLSPEIAAASESLKFQQEVEKRRELGQPIHILSQRQLLALIPSGAAIVRGS